MVAGSQTSAGFRTLIVVPAYNEQATLAGVIASLQQLPDGYEILIVDDGSVDGTAAVAEDAVRASRLPARVVHLPVNTGVGGAMQTGYRFAARTRAYRYVIQFDGDGQHDAGYIETLVAACESQALDLCIGSRFLAEDSYRSTPSRVLGIRLISWLIGALLGTRITDPTGGFRCAGPRAWASFARHYPEEYAEPESLFWCARHGFQVAEVPVRMHARQGGVTSMRWTKEIYYMMKVSVSILVDRIRARERFAHEPES